MVVAEPALAGLVRETVVNADAALREHVRMHAVGLGLPVQSTPNVRGLTLHMRVRFVLSRTWCITIHSEAGRQS